MLKDQGVINKVVQAVKDCNSTKEEYIKYLIFFYLEYFFYKKNYLKDQLLNFTDEIYNNYFKEKSTI